MGVVIVSVGTFGRGHRDIGRGVVMESVAAWGLVIVSGQACGGGCFSQDMWVWILFLQVCVGVVKVSTETCGCSDCLCLVTVSLRALGRVVPVFAGIISEWFDVFTGAWRRDQSFYTSM